MVQRHGRRRRVCYTEGLLTGLPLSVSLHKYNDFGHMAVNDER